MYKFLKKRKGITLISLVITIIVLLILAGVSIAMLTGENGILTEAQRAKNETEEARIEEENRISDYEDYISRYANGGYVESKGVNAPVLKDNMELVTYNEETGEWEENNSSSAYDYVAGTGTEDNNKSKWANARVTIDGVDSYFVWIPRYAYKITYNNPENKSEGGTIDVKFLVGTSDNYYDENGVLQKAERAETGQEDTTSDYYVHPAFTNNVDLGGWDSELTGIWVGKYETSLVDTSDKENITNVVTNDEGTGNILLSDVENRAIAVKPGMSSWRNCTIGNMYTNAKAYSENLNSHMLKNSEWGAVAYLTHSQYGRNGHEVTINNSSKYVTGSAGNSVNAEIDVGTTIDYRNEQGVLASSTGNVYGVYDLSGGACEYVTSYCIDGIQEFLDYGSSFTKKKASNKFSTAYKENETEGYKMGDATYEMSGWNDDYKRFVFQNNPFFSRGRASGDTLSAGVFSYADFSGEIGEFSSFRIALLDR